MITQLKKRGECTTCYPENLHWSTSLQQIITSNNLLMIYDYVIWRLGVRIRFPKDKLKFFYSSFY